MRITERTLMRSRRVGWIMCLGVAVWTVATPAWAEPRGTLDAVRGQGCYTAGDDDTPAKAKKTALALARQQAVESYRVYVQSTSTVKNVQVEEDLIDTVSAAILHDVQIEQQAQNDREWCVTITATINPVAMEEEIQKKLTAKEIAHQAQQPLLTAGSAFGVKVWTNKPDGRFIEGEPLVVSVQSDRDGYLKLDYFQADHTVVHLVPNVFGGEAFLKAGQVYTFGGPNGREQFTITGPFGAEAMKAVVSTQPFAPALSAGRTVDQSQPYLRSLQSGLRGVQVEAGAAQWAEASVGLVTASQAAAEHRRSLAGTRGIGKRAGPPEPVKPTSITGGIGSRPDDTAPRP